jgi:hypothetical protein
MVRWLDGAAGPFGWVVAPRGGAPSRFHDDVEALVAWSTDAWNAYFPPERGYTTSVETEPVPTADPAPIRWRAHRGDFRAEVTVERPEPASAAAAVRMFGRVTSQQMLAAEGAARRCILAGQVVGGLLGATAFVGLAWLSVGVADPIFVLGGLLMVVALVVTLTAGVGLGGWFGERVADGVLRRAAAAVQGDPGMEADLRRWASLSRKLQAQRAVLRGTGRQQPFRREPDAP